MLRARRAGDVELVGAVSDWRHAMTRAMERLDAASRLRGRYNAQDHALDLCEQARAILDGALRDARSDDITQRVEVPRERR